jgi:hypothetical protein
MNCPACRRHGPTLTTIKLKGAEELFREVKRFQAIGSSSSLRPSTSAQAIGSSLRPLTSSQAIGSSLRPSTSAQAIGVSLRPSTSMQGSSTPIAPITRQTSNPQFVNVSNVSNGELEDLILA